MARKNNLPQLHQLPRVDFAPWWHKLVIALILVAATIAAFQGLRTHELISYDDLDYITKNMFDRDGLNWQSFKWAFHSVDPEGHWIAGNYHPLTWISHEIDISLFGIDHPNVWHTGIPSAGMHHLMDLFFHLINTVLLFFILNRLTGRLWAAAFVAALFALHPLHIQSVAWASERKDVLSTMFFMLTIMAYVAYVDRSGPLHTLWKSRPQSWLFFLASFLICGYAVISNPPEMNFVLLVSLLVLGGFLFAVGLQTQAKAILLYFLAFLLFGLGLLAKPMLVTLPVILILLDFWPLGRLKFASDLAPETRPTNLAQLTRRERRSREENQSPGFIVQLFWSIFEKFPFLVVTLLDAQQTHYVQGSAGAVVSENMIPFTTRLGNAILAYGHYLRQIVWPTDLSFFYSYRDADAPEWLRDIFLSLLLLAAITTVVVYFGRKYRYLPVGWLWYLGMLVPVNGLFVQVGSQSYGDRYTYVPYVGVFFMIALGVSDLLANKTSRLSQLIAALGIAAIGAAVAALAVLVLFFWNPIVNTFGDNLCYVVLAAAAVLAAGLAALAAYFLLQKLFPAEKAQELAEAAEKAEDEAQNLDAAANKAEAEAQKLAAAGMITEADAKHNDSLKFAEQSEAKNAEALKFYARSEALHRTAVAAVALLAVAALTLTACYTAHMLHMWDDDESIYTRALFLDPDNAVAHNNWGGMIYQTKARPKADSANRLNQEAQNQENAAQQDDAIAKRAEAEGHHPEAVSYAAQAAKFHAEAASKRAEAVKLNEEAVKKFDEAEGHFSRAVELKPGYADALANLGMLTFERHAGQDISFSPVAPNAAVARQKALQLGSALTGKEPAGFQKTELCYLIALNVKADHPGALNNIGNLYRTMTQQAEAEEQKAKAENRPADAQRFHEDALRYRKACEDRYRFAVKAKPDLLEAWANLAVFLENEYHRLKGEAQIQGSQGHAAEAAAANKKAEDDFNEAVFCYERSIDCDPRNPRVHGQLAMLLFEGNRYREALPQYLITFQSEQPPMALSAAAWILATASDDKIRNGQKAVELADRAVQMTNHQFPQALDTLAAAYAEIGKFDDALRADQQALAIAQAGGPGAQPLLQLFQQHYQLIQAHQPIRTPAVPPPGQ